VCPSCTAFKTSPLDLEAYEALRCRREPGDSFSDVVKKSLRGRLTVGDFLERAKRARVSDETLAAVELEIRRRRRSPARAPKL
jgi:predicted CopG family antitoxin